MSVELSTSRDSLRNTAQLTPRPKRRSCERNTRHTKMAPPSRASSTSLRPGPTNSAGSARRGSGAGCSGDRRWHARLHRRPWSRPRAGRRARASAASSQCSARSRAPCGASRRARRPPPSRRSRILAYSRPMEPTTSRCLAVTDANLCPAGSRLAPVPAAVSVAAVATGAFLVFWVQPLFVKQLLPALGGASAT